VFHNRNFSYTSIVISKASGIRQGHVEDLKGKRFAVMDYQQTAALWIRGVLKHEFGVEASDMEWFQTRGANLSHMGASGSQVQPGVKLNYADADFGRLFLRGDIDASMGYGAPSASGIDRAKVDLSDNPDFPLLFPDPKAEGVRFFKKTGIFPPHHTTALRESILDKHPWVAMSLMDAFEKAKKIAIERVREAWVTEGLDVAVYPRPARAHRPRRLDGEQEAHLIALACSPPPAGRTHWTMRLLADGLVELRVVDGIAPETVRQTLKKHPQTVGEQGMVHPAGSQRRLRRADGRGPRHLHPTT
jgi:hypothetical protein